MFNLLQALRLFLFPRNLNTVGIISQNKSTFSHRGKMFSTLLLVSVCAILNAQQTVYQGPAGGDWFSAANWSAGLPAVGNNALIPGGGSVNIASPLTAGYNIEIFGALTASANLTLNGTVSNLGTFTLSPTAALVSNAAFTNQFGAILTVPSGTSATFNSSPTNNGTINLAGVGSINDNFSNGGTYNVLVGGSTTVQIGKQFNNPGTVLNKGTFLNRGIFTNNNNFYNEGIADNFSQFNQLNLVENRTGATFTNQIGGAYDQGFGSATRNSGTFSNKATINSVGLIQNDANFTNDASISVGSGGMIDNNTTFTNNGTITLLNGLRNDGTFQNNNLININSGSIVSNYGAFNNNPSGRIVNLFEIVNNTGGTFTNKGKIENQLRIFVDGGSFLNQSYVENSGDIFTKVGAIFNNSSLFNQVSGNFKNEGSIVNSKDFLSDDCSSIVNTGSINNTSVLKLRGILFQRGTLTGTAITNQGGYVHTNATSNAPAVCATRTITADDFGVVKSYATSLLAFNNFDSCTNIIYLANGIARPTFTCADVGTVKSLNLMIRTRLGDSLTCVATVNPVDFLAPRFKNCPTDITVNSPSDNPIVTWTAPTATDNCTATGSITIATTKAPGTTFPIGITAVTYTATDARANANQCQFKVNVVKSSGTSNCVGDVTAPVITNCPASFAVATNNASTKVSWTPPTVTDACSPLSISSTFSPGTEFKIGKDTIIYTAKDGNGNTSSCQFIISVFKNDVCVVDNIKPVFGTCPSNIYLPTDANLNGALAFWAAPAVGDNCALTNLTSTSQNATVFPVGNTTVTYTATDAANNTATCSFVVTVGADPCPGDVAPPVIAGCPPNIVINITSGNSAPATWTAPTATDPCSPVTFTSNFTPGANFPLGNTGVTYRASDRKGNSSTCNFNVLVATPCSNDVTAPVLSGCPANITVGTAGTSASATWTAPVASDNCAVAFVNSSYAPGTSFLVGTTSVVYTASDLSGNLSNCTFQVVVTTRPLCTTNASPINNATAINGTALTLTWNAIANATAYDVYLGKTATPTTIVAPNVVGTSAVVNNLETGTDYFWYVLPKNVVGSATGCATTTKFTTSGTPPTTGGGTGSTIAQGGICKGAQGTGLTRQTWNNIGGTAVADLTNNANYPNNPTSTDLIASSTSVWNIADNYGTRVRGFITPSQSGNYTFTITGDDETQFFIAQNPNPNNKFLAANIPTYTGEVEFTKLPSQKSSAIFLSAGQDYYIEVLQKEGGGGDGWGIYWTTPGATTTVNIPLVNLSPISTDCPANANSRLTSDLVVLYDFKEGSGNIIRDVSNNGTPLDLTIGTPANVTRLAGGCGISVNTSTTIRSATAATKINSALASTNAVTIEAWVKPLNNTQNGPSPILTYSADINNRNMFLGQSAGTYQARLRTSTTAVSGAPDLTGGVVNTSTLQHVVFTHDAAGNERLYVNNTLVSSGTRTGTLSTFNSAYFLALANGQTASNPWLGNMYLVAVYKKALSANEVNQNFLAGACQNTGVICKGAAGTGVTRELFNGISVVNFRANDLVSNVNYPLSPASSATYGSSISPSNIGDNYGSRVRAFLTPTVSGNYQFTVTGDDWTELYLSTNGEPASKVRIGYVPTFTVPGELTKFPEQRSGVIALTAGVNYYLELINIEGGGGDHWGIYWQTPGSASFLAIPTANLSPISTSCGGGGGTGPVCTTDTQVPTFSGCPTNQTLTTTTTSTTASWTAPTAADNCATPFRASNYLPGATFPLGVTNVVYTAVDTKGNSELCQFSITVNNACANDVTAPVLTACPANQSVTTSGITANATWVAPTATDACSTPIVSSNYLSGAAFAPGANIVRYTAIDARGNTATCQFTVTVNSTNPCSNDVTAPVIGGCPTSFTIATASATATANWVNPTVSDNCGTPQFFTNYIPGTQFPLGPTTVRYVAIDAAENATYCTFTVTVVLDPCANETVKPVLTACPANINLTAAVGATTAIATWTAPTATDNCPGTVVVTASAASGAAFPIGSTTVTYTARDVKNNTATCAFVITVSAAADPCATETIAPVLTACPANISVTAASGATTAIATWTAPTATDNCPGVVTVTGSANSGASFPIGSTTVTYTARDVRNNSATCTFTVTVSAPVTDPLDCANITISTSGGSINVSGLTAPLVFIQLFDANFAPVYSCAGNCSSPMQSINGLAAGTYFIKVDFLTASYQALCKKEQFITVTGGTGGGTGVLTFPVPANITVTAAVGQSQIVVNYPTPTATTTCTTGALSINRTAGPASGSFFPVGTTQVCFTATDGCNNTQTQCFNVVVNPASTGGGTDCGTISVVGGAGNITLSNLTAPVVFVQVFDANFLPVFSCAGNCNTPVQAINGLTAGIYFVKVDFLAANYAPICNKEQYVTVTSGGGNTGVLTFPVPANITVTATAGNNSAIVTYPNPPNATTTCTTGALSVVRTSGLASGSAFPVGTNQVCYTATDGCGNTQSRCFNVVVNSGGTTGGTDCNAITITPGAGNISIGNLTAPIVLIQVFDANFNGVFNCTGNCLSPTQIVSGLTPGTYFVKVDFLTASWTAICKKEEYVVVNAAAFGGSSDRNNEIVNTLQSFKVYPNPASSQVLVDLGDFDGQNVAISLINQLGQLVKRNEVTVSGSPIEIDVTDLRAGFYTVNVRTAAGVSKSMKLVIEKD
jgi:hypothetical protein